MMFVPDAHAKDLSQSEVLRGSVRADIKVWLLSLSPSA